MGVAGGRGPLVKARLMGHLQSGIVDGTMGPEGLMLCVHMVEQRRLLGMDAIA